MSLSVCPHCGFSLVGREPLSVGALEVDGDGVEFRWRGEEVRLTPTERCLVRSLAAAKGRTLSHDALIGIGGFDDTIDPLGGVRVYARRIRLRFLALDPSFDALKTIWGSGLRWAA